jgi:enolase-phosphatase E1
MQLANPVRGVLLDIEGTTSSIAFVRDVMFPFVLQHMVEFFNKHFLRPDVRSVCDSIAVDAGYENLAEWHKASDKPIQELVVDEVRRLMLVDAKATGLKSLQGLVWRQGFESGQLAGHVFPDVIPALRRWRESGVDLRIYSSGSIAAQKLYFGNTSSDGDCLYLFSGHYDTTIGGKKSVDSYRRIAEDWSLEPIEILFISDLAEELLAAQQAGFQIAASDRPGNKPLPAELLAVSIASFKDLEWPASPSCVH